MGAGRHGDRVWGEAEREGAAQSGSSDNPGSTSHLLPLPVLPSNDL